MAMLFSSLYMCVCDAVFGLDVCSYGLMVTHLSLSGLVPNVCKVCFCFHTDAVPTVCMFSWCNIYLSRPS